MTIAIASTTAIACLLRSRDRTVARASDIVSATPRFTYPAWRQLRLPRLGGLRIAEVAAGQRRERVVQLIEQRNTRRDVEIDDLLVADPIEMLTRARMELP